MRGLALGKTDQLLSLPQKTPPLIGHLPHDDVILPHRHGTQRTGLNFVSWGRGRGRGREGNKLLGNYVLLNRRGWGMRGFTSPSDIIMFPDYIIQIADVCCSSRTSAGVRKKRCSVAERGREREST